MGDAPVAWVVGASRGIGASSALAFAANGYRVALSARSGQDLSVVASSVEAAGATDVIVAPSSVRSTEQVEDAAGLLADRWGRVDVLVCSAGVSPVFSRSEALGDEDWDAIIDTNLSGTFRCCRAVFPLMTGRGGSIVNVSSVHGALAGPRLAAYAASKGGINALTRTLAVEWAPHGIRVNAVAPGYVATAMTEGMRQNEQFRDSLLGRIPAGRFADPSDVVSLISFLASAEAAYITGSVVYVDGGWAAQ